MRKTLVFVIGLPLVLVVGGVIVLSVRAVTGSVQATSSKHVPYTQQPYSQNPGMPAITPHLSTTYGPTFTENDVRQYLNSHPVPLHLSLPPGSKLVIVKIAFLPSREVSQLVGESTGMPDSYLLCYVELRGTVGVSGPAGSTSSLHKVEEIFDARTGNLLMVGGQ